jgi:hypothetical protein
VFLTAQPERAREARDAALGVVAKPFDPLRPVRVARDIEALRAGALPASEVKGLELFS